MSAVSLLLAAWVAFPALAWGIIAERSWHFLRTRRPRSALFHILPSMAACAALGYVAVTALALMHEDAQAPASAVSRFLVAVAGAASLASMAQLLHVLRVVPFGGEPPSRRWLVATYGVAVVVGALWIGGHLGFTSAVSEGAWRVVTVPLQLYEIAWLLGAFYYTARLARRGGWRPRGFLEVRLPDVLVPVFVLVVGMLGVGLAAMSGAVPARTSLFSRSPWLDAARGAIGLALAAPFAIRMLGEVVPRFLIGVVLLSATAGIVVAAREARLLGDPTLTPLVDFVTVLSLVLLLVSGRSRLKRLTDRFVLRRRRRRAARLQAAADELSVDLGTAECCRRALAAVARITQCRGAAILLPREGLTVVEGELSVDGLRRAWPADDEAKAILGRGLGQLEFADLAGPLREALVAAEVVALWPIRSPRRSWGHLVVTTGLLGAVVSDADAQMLTGFTAQLGRVLDGAELLERAVEVERSLAHAEKLAAIGELTARVAHEIRNPVAAARILAQQLASEPGSPFATEHTLILTELDRVEREVRSLLRFARRDDLSLAAIDLRQLVDATVGELGARFEAAKISVVVRGESGLTVSADREKMRQVLLNLLENACDALADGSDPKRITVEVGSESGSASLRVSDSGPGVAPDLLGRLFEPFFSQKAKGTGLGLAIVKRTVEAHRGRIEATAPPGEGLIVRIQLPLAHPAGEAPG